MSGVTRHTNPFAPGYALAAVGAVLTGLRAVRAVSWPWWAVTAPLWIGPAMVVATAVVLSLMFGWMSPGRRAR
jgi:hypothetical protein